MKKSLIWVMSLCLIFGLGACKSKQSAYKAAYEKAKEKEIAVVDEEEEEEEMIEKPTTRPVVNETFQKESLQAIDGTLRTYSVVIGSFQNHDNAKKMKSTYEEKGYNCSIALNTDKQMYRVIVGSFDNKSDAATLRDSVKKKYGLYDAWLLEKK